jgi:MOSC domain-containing protein YiiM
MSDLVPTGGVIEAIHIARAAGEAMRAVAAVRAVAGVGLDGDRYACGRGYYQDPGLGRDLTLIEAEVMEALAADGIALAPGETRRNLTTRGIGLNELVGHRFWVGDVLCHGSLLCEPCQYLVDLTGKPLLRPLVHRGGLRADIVRGGVIRRGDAVCAARGAKRLRDPYKPGERVWVKIKNPGYWRRASEIESMQKSIERRQRRARLG